jgi:Zn-dependent M28 family amino/carboxypeptidase
MVWMVSMPGESHRGPLPPLSPREHEIALALKRHVETLAGEIGERNLIHYQELCRAADFIEAALSSAGWVTRDQAFEVSRLVYRNVIAERIGTTHPAEIVVVGAHYDSVVGSPGANDNGSGVACLLELAAELGERPLSRTVRLAAFTNEEPPYFETEAMGSWVMAKDCRRRGENVVAMLSLETMGYYSDAPGSQTYPFPLSLFYPASGNFLAFVSNVTSRRLLHQVIGSFRRTAQFPSEGGALPALLPGVGWSDHWAFWQEGYRAVMLTDTAPFRYPHYHQQGDTPDKLDYERMARLVPPLAAAIGDLAEAR